MTAIDLPLHLDAADGRDRAASAAVRRRVGLVVLVIVCGFGALAGRSSFLGQPFEVDAGGYIYTGKVVAEGGRLYHDLWDNKLPGSGVFCAALWRWFGLNWAGYVLAQTAMAIGAAAMVWRCVGRHIGSRAGAVAGLFMLVMLNFPPLLQTGFQLEPMQAAFTAVAAVAACEVLVGGLLADALLVGLAGGCAAVFFKPTGLAPLAALTLVGVFSWLPIRRRLALLATVAFGALLPALVVLVYCWRTGILGDLPTVLREIGAYAGRSPIDLDLIVRASVGLGVLLSPLLIRGSLPWLKWLRHRDVRNAEQPIAPNGRIVAFIFVWLAIETIGIVMQGRMNPYYLLTLVPPLAFVFGIIGRSNDLPALAASVLPVTVLTFGIAIPSLSALGKPQPVSSVSEYLIAHASPSDAVWCDWSGQVLLETGLKSGCRLMTFQHFCTRDDAGPVYAKVMLDDFARTRPTYLVLPDVEQTNRFAQLHPTLAGRPERARNFLLAWDAIRAYVDARYTIEGQIGRQVVYRRID